MIETAPHAEQRYPTIGDWQFSVNEQELKITVSAELLGDDAGFRVGECYFYLIALHELVEAILCWNCFISQQEVDEFDQAHLDADEPGDLPEAPYRQQHHAASIVEHMVAHLLGVEWTEYEAALKQVSK